MSVSVGIVAYKSADNLGARLREIQGSDVQPDEVVVIVNPGPDEAENEEIKQRVQVSPVVTRYSINSQNIGVATAFNLAIFTSTTDYVIMLNDDCSIGRTAIGDIVDGFNSDSVGIVGVIAGGPGPYGVKGLTYAQGFLIAFRRKMVKKIGGYSELASPLACETELTCRASYHGWSTVIKPTVWSHVHDISNHPSDTINYLGKDVRPVDFQPKTQEALQEEIINLWSTF